jgi:hypothetical protein
MSGAKRSRSEPAAESAIKRPHEIFVVERLEQTRGEGHSERRIFPFYQKEHAVLSAQNEMAKILYSYRKCRLEEDPNGTTNDDQQTAASFEEDDAGNFSNFSRVYIQDVNGAIRTELTLNISKLVVRDACDSFTWVCQQFSSCLLLCVTWGVML